MAAAIYVEPRGQFEGAGRVAKAIVDVQVM